MKTYAFCPISDNKINERVARINAAFTAIIIIIFGITQSIYLIAFLAADFLLRAIPYSKFSLIGVTSRNIVRYLPFNEYFINAGPKIFAARIGLTFAAFIILTNVASFVIFSYVIAGVLLFFSFLEAAFGICVACKIYPIIYKLAYKEEFQD